MSGFYPNLISVATALTEYNITGISMDQGENQICPFFTISDSLLSPATQIAAFDLNSWPLLPEELSFSYMGLSWDCYRTPPSFSKTATGGVHRTTRYVPSIMRLLTKAYGKPIHFLACPSSKYNEIVAALDEDKIDIYFKEADIYPETGWLASEIIQILCESMGIVAECALDGDYNIGNSEHIYNPSTPVLQYIQSLIPPVLNVTYLATNDTLYISETDPAGVPSSLASPTNIGGYSSQAADVDPPNAWRVTGGMGKPRKDRFYDVILQDEEEHTDTHYSKGTNAGGATQTETAITYVTDIFGNPFYTKREHGFTIGKIFNNTTEEYSLDRTLLEYVITYQYEHTDSLIYSRPRILSKEKITSGYVADYVAGFYSPVFGRSFFLTKSLDVLTYDEFKTQFFAGDIDYTDILLSSHQGNVVDYEIHTETWEYATGNEPQQRFFEGVILNNSGVRYRNVVKFQFSSGQESQYYDVTSPALKVLQSVASFLAMKQAEPLSASVSTESVAIESYENVILQTGRGDYTFRKNVTEFELSTGNNSVQPFEETLNSEELPIAPTQYRRLRLQARGGLFGEPVPVNPVSLSVNTCNWNDLDNMYDVLVKRGLYIERGNTYDFLPRPVLVGQLYNGELVTATSAVESQNGHEIGTNTRSFRFNPDAPSEEGGFGRSSGGF